VSAELSDSSVRWLFAAGWAPPKGTNWNVRVPGATVDGLGTAADLLNLAIWSLIRQGLAQVEQLRPVEKVTPGNSGGASFARFDFLDDAARRSGIEGALLNAGHHIGAGDTLGERAARHFTHDDARSVRAIVWGLGLHSPSPWASVALLAQHEAQAAGLVGVRGFFARRPTVIDAAGVETLRMRDAQIVAARTAYREQHGDLDAAVFGDCYAALLWSKD
jgi:hypothetical protein